MALLTQEAPVAPQGLSTEVDPKLVYLASLLDDHYRIPGTSFQFGWDSIIGLIPGVGDLATILLGGLFLKEAKRLKASRWTQARMYGNYALDFFIGLVPLAGDLFDFAF